jgi:hypothetical protein
MIFFQEDQEPAFHSKMLVCVDDLFSAHPQLGSSVGFFRRTIEPSLQRDAIEPNETGNVKGRKGWTDIVMDG